MVVVTAVERVANVTRSTYILLAEDILRQGDILFCLIYSDFNKIKSFISRVLQYMFIVD